LTLTRRAFLVAAAAGAVAGCSGSGHSRAVGTTTTSTTSGAGAPRPSGDLAVAARAAAVENSIATAYGSVLDRLGPVPAGLKGLWQTFQSHHRDHATAWNAILTAAGDNAVTAADAGFSGGVVVPGLAAIKDLDGAIAFLTSVERTAAATYLAAIETALTTAGALQTAAAIQPIELQHVAMLDVLAVGDPVPAPFATTTGALPLR
jgi:hypothetical protein